MDEELKNLELDKPGCGKSQEQLQKHTLDTQLDRKPIERALYLLTVGDEMQKLSVIQSLPELIETDSQQTFARIIPTIQQQLPSGSNEFNLAASNMFGTLIQHKSYTILLSSVIQGIDCKDPLVSFSWIETMLRVIPTLPETQIKKEIIPFVIRKSSLTEPLSCRIASCKILGKVAVHPKLRPTDVKAEILPLAQGLCQDCHQDVRAVICAQLIPIAQGLGEEISRTNILSSIVELSSDGVALVRASAITAVSNIIEFVSPDAKKTTIIPLVMQLFEKSVSVGDVTTTTLSREAGRILRGLQPYLEESDTFWFLDCYKALSIMGLSRTLGDIKHSSETSKGIICRQNCAYNLPAMAVIVLAKIPSRLDLYYTIFTNLAADSYYGIRRTVAASIHEVARILESNIKLIKLDIIRLLRDDAEEVLQALVPNIGKVLLLFATHGAMNKEIVDQTTMDLGRGILKCQMIIMKGTNNWRLLNDFLGQLEYLPHCFPSDFIHQHFSHPVLNCVLNGKAKPVRTQATRTLLTFLRFNNKEVQRKWLRDSLVTQLCYSQCCYTRRVYVYMCEHAINMFSKKYFKEHFFEPLLSLLEDPVSNVRLCAVKLLPQLEQMIVSSDDKNLKAMLDLTISSLQIHERDKDILEIYKAKVKEIERLRQTDDQRREEVRRLEEEEIIIKGLEGTSARVKKTGQTTVRGRTAPGVRQTPTPRPIRPQQSITSNSTTMNAPSSGIVQSNFSELNFLEQHFYTDAGVILPTTKMKSSMGAVHKNQNECENVSLDSLIQKDLRALNISSNITDDVKVNLRKISGSSNKVFGEYGNTDNKSKLVNKRHSSILSSSCLENVYKSNALKRRSLNLSKDLSRIPTLLVKSPAKPTEAVHSIKSIAIKNAGSTENKNKEHEQTSGHSTNKIVAKANENTKKDSTTKSNLPVRIKRQNTDMRR